MNGKMLSLEILNIMIKDDLLDSILQGRILSLQEADEWLKNYINDQFKTTDKSFVHSGVDKNTLYGRHQFE